MSTTHTLTCERFRCSLPLNSGHSSFCILHDPSEDKNVNQFREALEEKITKDEKRAERIDLSGVVFPAWADFRGKDFKKAVIFANARFTKGASFIGAKFAGRTRFREAKFTGIVSFVEAKFASRVSFRGAEFVRTAFFVDAEFTGSASFVAAKFTDRAFFVDAEFAARASFRGAEFTGGVDFTGARFSGGVAFVGSSFPPKDGDVVVSFQGLAPENAKNMRFEGVALSRVSFLRTDVTQIRFVGCTWHEKPAQIFWPLPWQFLVSWPGKLPPQINVIYNDGALKGTGKGRESEHQERPLVVDLYRQLRLNLEASRQEVEAGDFYIGQMEMRRQDPSYSWHYRLLLAMYRILAMYGQSYWRPLVWYAFVLGPLFALGYWKVGSVSYAEGWFSALTAGVLFKDVPKGIVEWEKMLVYSNMLFDILLLALTVLALRRHFSR